MFYDKYCDLSSARGLTPSAAATKAGFNKGTVSVWRQKWEAGIDVVPSKDILDKLCVYFGVSAADLLDENKKATTLLGDGLTPLEQSVLDAFRSMPEEKRQALLLLLGIQ